MRLSWSLENEAKHQCPEVLYLLSTTPLTLKTNLIFLPSPHTHSTNLQETNIPLNCNVKTAAFPLISWTPPNSYVPGPWPGQLVWATSPIFSFFVCGSKTFSSFFPWVWNSLPYHFYEVFPIHPFSDIWKGVYFSLPTCLHQFHISALVCFFLFSQP